MRKDLVQSTSLRGSKFTSCRGIPYRAVGISEDVFIHPSSVLFGKSPPEYIIFQDAVLANQLWLKSGRFTQSYSFYRLTDLQISQSSILNGWRRWESELCAPSASLRKTVQGCLWSYRTLVLTTGSFLLQSMQICSRHFLWSINHAATVLI